MIKSEKWRKGKGDYENFGSVDKSRKERHSLSKKRNLQMSKVGSYYNKKICCVQGTSLLGLLRNVIARTCTFKYQELYVDCHYGIIQADIFSDIMASL